MPIKIKNALISLSDKNELDKLLKVLQKFKINIISSGGTFREIKKLILKSKNLLKINGKLIFEIGKGQERFSKFFLNMNGFFINKISQDINSIPRVVVSTKIS